MSEKFTAAEEAIITKASQDLHRYGKICEEHSVILRRDVEGSIKAHQEYTANSPPMDFMPPRDEFDHYTEVSEKVLTSECRTALEHVCELRFEWSDSANRLFFSLYDLLLATFM